MAQIKTKAEIAKIKKACEITDAIFSKIVSDFYFQTEIELQQFIITEIKKRKLRPSFPPIVTSGKQAGNDIHPKPTDAKLKGFVIIDFGVVYRGYMSDMTRTVFIGTPTVKEKQVYDLVLKAKETATLVVFPGIKCTVADQAARDAFGKYAKYFIHTLGHGVGKKIHEAPKIFFKRTKPYFREHMIVTIEPGLYIPNKSGIRIEDTGVVTQKGFIALTRSPKKLFVFKKK